MDAAQPLRPSWALVVATLIVLAACEIAMAGCWAALASVLEHPAEDLFETIVGLVYFSVVTLAFGAIACGQYHATFQHNTVAACLISGLWLTSFLLVSLGFLLVSTMVVADASVKFRLDWYAPICLLAGFIAATNFTWARHLERLGVQASRESRQLSMAGVLVLMTLLAAQFGIAAFIMRLSR